MDFEAEARKRGFSAVCGVDEAGCGPLAGAVYAAAVIIDPERPIEGLRDSKKLTEKARERLYDIIRERAAAYAVALATAEEIDSLNILQARLLAMRRAVAALSIKADFCLVDGNRDPGPGIETLCIVKGDAVCCSISAASVLAKVERDRAMAELHEKYPMYGFDRHKGYPTAAHYAALREHGPCPEHRLTFLKKLH